MLSLRSCFNNSEKKSTVNTSRRSINKFFYTEPFKCCTNYEGCYIETNFEEEKNLFFIQQPYKMTPSAFTYGNLSTNVLYFV